MKASRFLLVLFAIWFGWTVPAAVEAAQSKTTKSGKSTPGKTASGKSSSTTSSSGKKTSSKGSKKSRKPATPKQTAPTPERIREIQGALNKSGFAVEESGQMDAPTAEALKRFQEQQKLPVTGKLSSLTLIGLGLGPNQDAASGRAEPAGAKEGNR